MKPNIILEPSNSIITKSNFTEKISLDILQYLIKSDILPRIILSNYYVLKDLLKSYYYNYNSQLSGVVVGYRKSNNKINKCKYGRAYPIKGCGLTSFNRVVRNTLIKDKYYDFDLQNAQLDILFNICKNNNINTPKLEEYVKNRKFILDRLSSKYGTEPSVVKKLFISITYFGSFNKWCIDNKIKDTSIDDFIKEFQLEIIKITKIIKSSNIKLYELIKKTKPLDSNLKGSFLSSYLQEYEFQIVSAIVNWLSSETELLGKHKIMIYEFDGIKLYSKYVNKYYSSIDDFLVLLNKKTFILTGFNLKWMNKPIDEFIDIDINTIEKSLSTQVTDLQNIELYINSLNSDKGLAYLIYELYPNNFIYNDNGWYCWNTNLKRWETSDNLLILLIMDTLVTHIKNKISHITIIEDDIIECKNIKQKILLALKQIENRCSDFSLINKIVGICKTKFKNNEIKFDDNPKLFGFNNGVLDFNYYDEGINKFVTIFRPAKPTDYVTWSCGYDFIPIFNTINSYKEDQKGKLVKLEYNSENYHSNKDKVDLLENIFKMIHPDEKIRNLVFKICSAGLYGQHLEKFFVMSGRGRNGKSLMNEIMKVSIGDYYYELSSTVLIENQSLMRSRESNPEIFGLDKKRYVVCREPPKNLPLKNSVVKNLTGGTSYKARNNHSNKTDIKISHKLIMECNSIPTFEETPEDADIYRIVNIPFMSKFVEEPENWDCTHEKLYKENPIKYKQDYECEYKPKHIYPVEPKYKDDDWLLSIRNVFMNILIKHLVELLENDYKIEKFIPYEIEKTSLLYLQKSYEIDNIFTNYYEECSKDDKLETYHTLALVVSKLRETKEYLYEYPKYNRNFKKEWNSSKIKEFFTKNKIYGSLIKKSTLDSKIYFIGYKLKSNEFSEQLNSLDDNN
jgi:phage/plasmid-associated DNA primase